MSTHADVLESVAAQYRERGYQVDVEPTGPNVPDFLAGFRPDLIARGQADNVVVEVKVGTRTAVAERLREIAERVNREPGWRFSVVFADPQRPGQFVEGETVSLALLEQRVQKAQRLLLEDQQEAAFLLLWSALEGILRLLGERVHLPLKSLPPSALIRELYSEGELSREQFDVLIRILPLRNQLVHGLEAPGDIQSVPLARITQSLLTELKERPSTGPV